MRGIYTHTEELTLQHQDSDSGNATYVHKENSLILTINFNEAGYAIKAPEEIAVIIIHKDEHNWR